jgi:hypothetical protein
MLADGIVLGHRAAKERSRHGERKLARIFSDRQAETRDENLVRRGKRPRRALFHL